jgi:hypothetical protein
VQLVDSKPFTMLSEYCNDEDEVREAALEKFCRPAIMVKPLDRVSDTKSAAQPAKPQ